MFISDKVSAEQQCKSCIKIHDQNCHTSECSGGWTGHYELDLNDLQRNIDPEDLVEEAAVLPDRSGSALDTQVGGGHYKNMAIQPVEFCQKNHLDHCESSIVKYACRHKDKNGAEDVRKIIHYAQLILELTYGES